MTDSRSAPAAAASAPTPESRSAGDGLFRPRRPLLSNRPTNWWALGALAAAAVVAAVLIRANRPQRPAGGPREAAEHGVMHGVLLGPAAAMPASRSRASRVLTAIIRAYISLASG